MYRFGAILSVFLCPKAPFTDTPAGKQPTIEEAFNSYSSLREETVNSIKKYLQTDVIDKYLWRGTAFNRNIKMIKRIFKRLKIEYQENDIVRFQNLYIDIDSLNEQIGENHDQL